MVISFLNAVIKFCR